MRLLLRIFVICVILLSGNLSFADATIADGAPHVLIPEPNFKIEQFLTGSELQHEFKVRNTGTATLVIEKVLTG